MAKSLSGQCQSHLKAPSVTRRTGIANLVINPDGSIEGHLTDQVEETFDLSAIGNLFIKRLTSVEWDHNREMWVARLLSTGEEIACGKRRKHVLKDEAIYVESMQWQKRVS